MRRVVAHAFVDDLDRPALTDREFHHFSRCCASVPGKPCRSPTVEEGQGCASGGERPSNL